ncbi:MAG: hypothetical protein RLZ25_1287 [Pseudomonadota bacterium]
MRSSFFFRLPLFLLILLASACAIVAPGFATVTFYDFGAGISESKLLDAYPVKLLVEDLRPQVVAFKKMARFVGTAENGMGEPRDVLNRDGCPEPVSVHRTPHCLSLAESIRHRLKNESTLPSADSAKPLVLIEIRQWQTRAGSNLRLDYALDVFLRSSSGETLSKASVHGEDEVIDTQAIGKINFENHEAKEHVLSLLVSGALDAKMNLLLAGPFREALSRQR